MFEQIQAGVVFYFVIQSKFVETTMKIIRAEHLGMCFGVKDAIALALETARREPLTILGDLVHNETVLAELRAEGIRIGQKPAEIGTQTVMITAHGASERRMDETRELGLNVLEATCPLVHVAHRSLAKLVREGFHPVIIGKRDHVEVRGMTEDLANLMWCLAKKTWRICASVRASAWLRRRRSRLKKSGGSCS